MLPNKPFQAIAALKRYWERRRRAAHAKNVAESAFVAAYPSKRLVHSMTAVFHEDADTFVLQLCEDWGGIPPRRSWWLLTSDGTCRELSWEEAGRFKPIPAWR